MPRIDKDHPAQRQSTPLGNTVKSGWTCRGNGVIHWFVKEDIEAIIEASRHFKFHEPTGITPFNRQDRLASLSCGCCAFLAINNFLYYRSIFQSNRPVSVIRYFVLFGCRSGTRTPIPSSRGMCPTIRRTGKVRPQERSPKDDNGKRPIRQATSLAPPRRPSKRP